LLTHNTFENISKHFKTLQFFEGRREGGVKEERKLNGTTLKRVQIVLTGISSTSHNEKLVNSTKAGLIKLKSS
jgi:hypothetical protein